jgi:hypothetical protein
MNDLFDNPIVANAALCLVVGCILAGLARFFRSPVPAGLVPPVVFVASYVSTYQQIPDFPPVGSTNKIFYIAIAAAAVGLLVDLVSLASLARQILGALATLTIVVWIGLPRFANPDAGLFATALLLWLGGALTLWRIEQVSRMEIAAGGGSLVALAILTLLALGFAPVALAGASSTSLMLCVGLGAGFGVAALWELALPRRALTAATLLGAGGGLFAIVATVTLITRQIDFPALILLLAVLYVGQLGARLLLPSHRIHGRVRQVLTGLIAALPLLLVLAELFARHPDAFTI